MLSENEKDQQQLSVCEHGVGFNEECETCEAMLTSRCHPLEYLEPKQSVESLLVDRKRTHGDFEQVAITAQFLKYTMGLKNSNLQQSHKEALDMIATKIARILHGNPNTIDHWKDIAGYAMLVVEILEATEISK